ncbi:MAG: hypothetical protein NVS4B9_30210 [Ktedonobacteraceae bacterium]
MLTRGMQGVLAEQEDPLALRRVLDVGCGTGGWLIDVALAYTNISILIGADISKKMVDYARMQAAAQQVSDRVEFHVMDALRMLEFPDGYFDLVNQRFGGSYLRKWDWPGLLQKYQRVTKRGGIIRITEVDFSTGRNTSPALAQLHALASDAFYNAGHYFTQSGDGFTGQLASLLRQHGLQNVRTRTSILEHRPGTPDWNLFAEDMKLIYRTLIPFLRKWTKVPDDYEQIYRHMLAEIQQPDFVVEWKLLTAWGTNP